MPNLFSGNESGSKLYVNYVYTRSLRDPKTKKLILRANAVNRTNASCLWLGGYKTQPASVYLVGKPEASSYLAEYGSSAYARAYAKFREAAWGDVQASLAVDWAERKQSFALVYESLMRMVKAVVLIRKGKFKAAASMLGCGMPKGVSVKNTFAANWLAFRLGWTPFIGSIDSALQTIDSPVAYSHRFCYGRGVAPFKGAPTPSYWHDIATSGVYRVTIKAKVEVSDPSLARLNQFGLLNPFVVAWELIPLSFMIDRIIKVGDYLSSFDDFVGLSFSDMSITYGLIGSESWTVNRNGFPYGGIGTINLKALIKRKNRVITSSIPVPSIQMGKGLFASAEKSADAAALLIQLLRRK